MKTGLILAIIAVIVLLGFSMLKSGENAVNKMNAKRNAQIEQILNLEK